MTAVRASCQMHLPHHGRFGIEHNFLYVVGQGYHGKSSRQNECSYPWFWQVPEILLEDPTPCAQTVLSINAETRSPLSHGQMSLRMKIIDSSRIADIVV